MRCDLGVRDALAHVVWPRGQGIGPPPEGWRVFGWAGGPWMGGSRDAPIHAQCGFRAFRWVRQGAEEGGTRIGRGGGGC